MMKASGEVWSYHSNRSHQEVFVSHAMSPLPKPVVCGWRGSSSTSDWPLRRAAERWNCLGHHRPAVGRPLPRRRPGRHGRPVLAPALVPRSHAVPGRAPRDRAAGLPPVGPGPDRLPAGAASPRRSHKILRRYGCPPLAWTDPATGVRIKRPTRRRTRYVHAAPGDLVHVDIKKLGRIPDGGGHRCRRAGRPAGRTPARAAPATGTSTTPSTTTPGSAYSELLNDERKETAAGVLAPRQRLLRASVGITVHRVLTDNGSCYRSKAFAAALGATITHKRTRPYRPQTNGKVERFNRTMLEEWAYARPYRSEAERAAGFTSWLHTYNHHRGHTARQRSGLA